jgi:hypothetical protein
MYISASAMKLRFELLSMKALFSTIIFFFLPFINVFLLGIKCIIKDLHSRDGKRGDFEFHNNNNNS